MTGPASPRPKARVASLHVHPIEAGPPMLSVNALTLDVGLGVREDPRYFGRRGSSGQPSRRQVSLIEREQIAEHAAALGLENLPPGAVRSNIETEGVDLQSLLGQRVRIGEALLQFVEPRHPCAKMDALCQGLRALMENNRQGVLAVVVQSGTIRVGDEIRLAGEGAAE